jgi:hypothetical protein
MFPKLLALYKTLWVFNDLKNFQTVFACSCNCSSETISQFKRFASTQEHPKHFGFTFTNHELLEAERFVLKEVQQSCFPKEISALKEGRDIPKSSIILPLPPFLDDDGVMRVGGR